MHRHMRTVAAGEAGSAGTAAQRMTTEEAATRGQVRQQLVGGRTEAARMHCGAYLGKVGGKRRGACIPSVSSVYLGSMLRRILVHEEGSCQARGRAVGAGDVRAQVFPMINTLFILNYKMF
jgi:hypothetical protein